MRVGIFGGTFDPVHIGHLIMAEQSREQARLDRVWFVPSARPPHKRDVAVTSFAQRVEMLSLALVGRENHFRIETIENDRSGPSYTIDTLVELRRLHPGVDFCLMVGSDCLPDLPKWSRPHELLRTTELVVSPRVGSPSMTAAQVAELLQLPADEILRITHVDLPHTEFASRDLRARAAAGRSLLWMMPESVEVYIRENRLYRG